ERDEGDRRKPALAHGAHHLAAGDAGEALDVRLDLRGRHQIAAEAQDVAHARLEHEAAVAFEAAEIAGAQPAVLGDGAPRSGLVAEMAGHEARPADRELAALARAQQAAAFRIAHARAIALADRKAAAPGALDARRLRPLAREKRLDLAHAV